MSDVPTEISDTEQLNRRIHPTFVKPDGSVSSAAFTDPSMSVDREKYRTPDESLLNYVGYGLAGFLALIARNFGQNVYSDQKLLNKAHAIVEGKKTKSIARKFAKNSNWVVNISGDEGQDHTISASASN